MTPNLSPTQLRTPKAMRATLRAAYQFTLWRVNYTLHGPTTKRLSRKDEIELGRRLAFYWGDKP